MIPRLKKIKLNYRTLTLSHKPSERQSRALEKLDDLAGKAALKDHQSKFTRNKVRMSSSGSKKCMFEREPLQVSNNLPSMAILKS